MTLTRGAETLSGRYRLGARLGQGGMAEVYAADDLRLGRNVAIKLLRRELGADPAVRQRFEREACTAARISHPNIVGIVDIGEDDGLAFIIMERLDGTTLADELTLGPLSEFRVREVARQVLAALSAAHSAGVVHRDIKPANILTCADGRVKVADFGIATALDEAQHITSTGWLVGTPAYVAPERVLGQTASPASDLYSLGAVLYECLTGKRPFSDKSTMELLAAIREEVPVPVAELRAGVGEDLCETVDACLRKDPDARPSSAELLARVLERSLAETTEVRLAGTREAFVPVPTNQLLPETKTAALRQPSQTSEKLHEWLASSPVSAVVARFRVGVAFAGSLLLALAIALVAAGSASGSPAPSARHLVPSLPGRTAGGGGTAPLGTALSRLSEAIG